MLFCLKPTIPGLHGGAGGGQREDPHVRDGGGGGQVFKANYLKATQCLST